MRARVCVCVSVWELFKKLGDHGAVAMQGGFLCVGALSLNPSTPIVAAQSKFSPLPVPLHDPLAA